MREPHESAASRRRGRTVGTFLGAVILVAGSLAGAGSPNHPEAAAAAGTDHLSAAGGGDAGGEGPEGLLAHEGRWFVDDAGRVVQLHGVNMVQKYPVDDPLTPADVGFDRDDAIFLREQGMNVVRLGVVFGAVMPQPGVIDHGYVDSIAQTVRVLAAEGIYVQLDMHQDGFGPLVHGNGFPAWATLTDGLPNPPATFPLYYVQNPALQRAFDNFWENRPGPDGVPLQEHYATALQVVAASVADEPFVLGYDTMNEPWPGTVWDTCVLGCPDIEQARLAPFSQRMTEAIREVDTSHFVFTEPFVLFNFGRSATSLSGFGAPRSALSFHVYALLPEDDEATIDNAIEASSRGDAILATEFGATNDPATLDRLTGALDSRLVPWIFWAYNENVIIDEHLPPTPDNIRLPVVTALARPYATATNGTPSSHAYDPATRSLDYGYATVRPDGTATDPFETTVLAMPPTAYPDGYTVEVTGASIVSAPDAPELVLCNDPGATAVQVRVVPGSDPAPEPRVTCDPPVPPPDAGAGGVSRDPGAPAGGAPVAVAPPTAVATAVPASPRVTG